MFHDSTPILTLSYSIYFYITFFSVPYLVVLLLKKLKIFKELNLKMLLRTVLDLQIIFLFSFILLPGLILLLVSTFFGEFLGGIYFFGLILKMMPVVIIYNLLHFLWLLRFLFEAPFFLLGFIFVYVWARMSYNSIKKHLKIKTKEIYYFLITFVLIILLFNSIGQYVLNNLHYQYYYCPQNILCPR